MYICFVFRSLCTNFAAPKRRKLFFSRKENDDDD